MKVKDEIGEVWVSEFRGRLLFTRKGLYVVGLREFRLQDDDKRSQRRMNGNGLGRPLLLANVHKAPAHVAQAYHYHKSFVSANQSCLTHGFFHQLTTFEMDRMKHDCSYRGPVYIRHDKHGEVLHDFGLSWRMVLHAYPFAFSHSNNTFSSLSL